MQRQKLVRWIGLAFIMTLVTGLASFIPAMAQAPAVFINEIQVSTSSTDWEFFELQGAAGTDLSSLTLIGVESDAGPSAGTIDREISLLGQTIPSDGFFLGINTTGAATYGVTGDIDIPENAFENGTATYFLVADFTGAAGDDLDTNDDGVLDVTPWSEIVDSINIRDSASDFDYAAASVVGPDGTFLPSGTYRCPDAPAGTFGSNILNFSTPNGTPGTSNILTCGLPDVWINEIHYDNASTDTGEAVEVAGPAGTDLTGWSLVLYNGNGGAPYNTVALSGILPDQDNGFGTAFESISGIQNGAPDGLALVYGGTAVQFLSYEGSFTAVGGPADGMTSTDIGVAEAGSSAIGDSLQLVGTGLTYADFSWAGSSPNTFGAVNTGQAFGTPVVTGQPLPLDEGFDDCTLAGWEIISVDTDTSNTWGCNSFFSNIDANGFSDSAPANEWLITPPLNMDAQVDDILTFRSYTRFTDINYPQVHVLYSMDYDGGGDPTTATWTELTGINFSPEGSSTWVDSGKVDLSGISGDTVYFAFQYVSSGTGGGSAANWRLDAISFEEDPEKKIHQVQGSGAESPHVGKTVIIEGIVVGDFQDNDGDTNDLNGFFVQEEDFDTDANPLTSEGIFVYDGSSPAVDVAVGDLVSVTGSVSEFDGLTEITSFSGVEVVSSGNPLPAASILSLPVGSVEDFEAYEGMLVTFPQSLYISEFFNFDRFGEIVLTSERQFQPTATYEPGSDAAKQLREDNKLGRITLDDGRTASNPDPAIHPNSAVFNLDNLFRGGDIVNDVTGVISYGFGLYRIQPTAGAAFTSMNPRTDMPDDVGGNLKVAAFNVLNYFTTLDDGSNDICGPLADQECRGADSAEEFERQRDKIIAAIAAIDADVVGLIEIENHPGDVPVADLVSGLNDEMGAGTYEYVATGALGSDAIRQAFIYKPATVSLVGDYAALDTPEFLDPLDYGDDKNRPALAQTFIDNETGGIFTAVVNHLKSKGTPCGPEDDDEMAASCPAPWRLWNCWIGWEQTRLAAGTATSLSWAT